MGIYCCLRWRDFHASRVRDGYIFGLAGTRGHARRLATQRRACSADSKAQIESERSCKPTFRVARAGATRTPSFASEGSGEAKGGARRSRVQLDADRRREPEEATALKKIICRRAARRRRRQSRVARIRPAGVDSARVLGALRLPDRLRLAGRGVLLRLPRVVATEAAVGVDRVPPFGWWSGHREQCDRSDSVQGLPRRSRWLIPNLWP
jgi:hypothetical protein